MKNPDADRAATVLFRICGIVVEDAIVAHNNDDNEEEKKQLMKLVGSFQRSYQNLGRQLENMGK